MVGASIQAKLDGQGRLYQQIYRAIKGDILSGHLGHGEKLPSIRTLSADFGVSKSVVQAALECLTADELIHSVHGSGIFVTYNLQTKKQPLKKNAPEQDASVAGKPAPAISNFSKAMEDENPHLIFLQRLRDPKPQFNLEYGTPVASAALRTKWSKAMTLAARLDGEKYAEAAGEISLRTEIARYICKSRGIDCSPEDIIICNGAQQAFDLVSRCLYTDQASVAFEDPGYFNARRTFHANGYKIIPVPVDENGMQIERLLDLSNTNIRLACVTPSHQMPLGSILSLDRRQMLLAWAARNETVIMEDDYDGEFRFGSRYIPSLKSMDEHDNVIYIGTFSKTIFPSLRLGYIIAPERFRTHLLNAKTVSDLGTSALLQKAAAIFIHTGGFAQNLAATRKAYAQCRNALITSLKQSGRNLKIVDGAAGLHVSVLFPEAISDRIVPLTNALLSRSVSLHDPRDYFFEKEACNMLIFGCTQIDKTDAAESVGLIAEEMARHQLC